jgi:hypothetical protein
VHWKIQPRPRGVVMMTLMITMLTTTMGDRLVDRARLAA